MQPIPEAPAPTHKKKLIAIISALVVVGIIVASIFIFSNRSLEDAIEDYAEALISCDGEKMLSLYPDGFLSKHNYGVSEHFLVIAITDALKDEIEYFEEDGVDQHDIKYRIKDTERASIDDIRELKEAFDMKNVEIEDAVEVDIVFYGKAYDDDTKSNTIDPKFAKINGSWYLVDIY